MNKIFIPLFFLFTVCNPVQNGISVDKAFIKLVPETSPNTAAFATIKNGTAKDVSLIKAESEISNTVELHDMVMENEVMVMRPVEKILIKANSSTELKPGSLHIMFIGLKSPLQKDAKHKVSLTFDDGQKIQLDLSVKEVNMEGGHQH
jgi:periplasmic copper chaperone A